MILAADRDIGKWLEKYRKELSLPDELQAVGIDGPGLGEVNRVLYIADMENGGSKRQLDFIRRNTGVDEWLIYCQGMEEDARNFLEDCLHDVQAQKLFISDPEELKKALAKPAVRKNSCLVITKESSGDAQEISARLGKLMPGWSFETASFLENAAAIRESGCSRFLILGRRPGDFYGISVPPQVQPVLALTCMEDDIRNSKYPDEIRRNACGSVRGLNWGEELQKKNFFMISVIYESWRCKCAGDAHYALSLAQDQRFVMWDRFGLPMSREAYTKERIEAFLARFDGLERLAKRLMETDA